MLVQISNQYAKTLNTDEVMTLVEESAREHFAQIPARGVCGECDGPAERGDYLCWRCRMMAEDFNSTACVEKVSL